MQKYKLAIVFISLSVTASAQAHVDAMPYVSNNRLFTGSASFEEPDITTPVSYDQRVFGAEFGEDDVSQPFFTEDPGFLAPTGALPGGAGKKLGFNVLDGLKYWDGTGAVNFGAVPSGESMYISLGSQHTQVSTSPVPGFGFTIGANEGLHDHLDWLLFGSDNNPIPGDGIEPATGVYLLQMELWTTIPGVASSDPIWFVYNNHVSEDVHDAAVDWVTATYTPEPASCLMFLVGGSIALVRRRAARTA